MSFSKKEVTGVVEHTALAPLGRRERAVSTTVKYPQIKMGYYKRKEPAEDEI